MGDQVDRVSSDELVNPAAGGRWVGVGLLGFTLGGGLVIFVGGTPYFELTAANDSPLYNAMLVTFFWLLARLLRGRPLLASYATCSHALFIAATAMLVLVIGPFNWLVTADDGSVQQAVQDKLAQFLAVVPVILLLTWAARRPWGWIYLQRGQPKRWLIFGLSSFVISAIVHHRSRPRIWNQLGGAAAGCTLDSGVRLSQCRHGRAVVSRYLPPPFFRGNGRYAGRCGDCDNLRGSPRRRHLHQLGW